MKSSERIILGAIISLIICLVIYGVYRIFRHENYKKLRNLGYFPILPTPVKKGVINDDSPKHKYDGHRYKQKRRYNFLSQQSIKTYD